MAAVWQVSWMFLHTCRKFVFIFFVFVGVAWVINLDMACVGIPNAYCGVIGVWGGEALGVRAS